MSSTMTAFITAATGSQGSAVATHMQELGWKIHATTRNRESAVTQALEKHGARITLGDWDNEEALKSSIAGCDLLFLNTMPDIFNPSSDQTRVASIVNIAKAAGVRHVVYSSSVSVDQVAAYTFLPSNSIVAKLLESKRAAEDLVKAAGFEHWTILRPANFMANFLLPKVAMTPDLPKDNVWKTALLPETRLPLIDHDDIGKFAVAAFEDPARFHGKTINLAAEFLAPAQVMEQLSEASGRTLRAEFYSEEEVESLKAVNPFIQGHLGLRSMAGLVDLDEIKGWCIPLTSFKQFLSKNEEDVKATYS